MSVSDPDRIAEIEALAAIYAGERVINALGRPGRTTTSDERKLADGLDYLLAALRGLRDRAETAERERDARFTQADLDFFSANADEYFAMANAARAELAGLRERETRLADALAEARRHLGPRTRAKLDAALASEEPTKE